MIFACSFTQYCLLVFLHEYNNVIPGLPESKKNRQSA